MWGGTALIFTLSDCPLDFSEVGIVVLASSLFLLAVNNPQKLPSTYIEKIGRDYSLYIYIFHIAIGNVLAFAANKVGVASMVGYYWLHPILVAGCAVAFSAVLVGLQIFRKKKI